MIKRINPFAQIIEMMCAFSHTEKFYNLRKQSIGSRIAYAFIISIICSIIFCSIHVVKSNNTIREMINILPDFSYANGCMQFMEKYEELDGATYISVNTDQPVYTSDYAYELVERSDISSVMLFSETNVLICLEDENDCAEIAYEEIFGLLGIDSFTKQQALSGHSGLVSIVAIISIFLIIPYNLIKLFGFALFFAFLGRTIKSVRTSNIDFLTLYWISFYIESLCLLVISIGKPLFPDYELILHSACIFMFAITMEKIHRCNE